MNRIVHQARLGWASILPYSIVLKESQHRCRLWDEIIYNVVRFLLQARNVQLLSSGTKRLNKHGRTVVDFPTIRRQRCKFHIFEDYQEERKTSPLLIDGKQQKELGRIIFTKIVAPLTHCQ